MTSLRYCQSIFLISAFLFLSQWIFAQTSKTILSGVVTDPQGAGIPNARIISEGKDGNKFSSLTNGDGFFELALTDGLYKIEITNPPFTKFVIADYLVVKGTNVRLVVALQCNKGCAIIDEILPPEQDIIVESENLAVSNQILSRVKPNTRKAVKKSKKRIIKQ
jgi:hypothetical protein